MEPTRQKKILPVMLAQMPVTVVGKPPGAGPFKRVLIVGSAGAGKTILAVRLAAATGLPLIHLDRHFWNAGWIPTPGDQWAEEVRELIKGDRWIIDGNYGSTLDMRMQRADSVVFMDFSRYLCIFRILRRVSRHISRTRPDMAEGCPDRVDLEFLRWIWRYPRRTRPVMREILDRHADRADIYRLTSSKDARNFLESIGRRCRSDGN